jgi:hypothetical protein
MTVYLTPKPGSQHEQFLKLKAPVVAKMSPKLFELYETCTHNLSEIGKILTVAWPILRGLCKSDRESSYSFSIEFARTSILNLSQLISDEGKKSLPSFENALIQTLYEIGYRDGILTPLEIRLSGGEVTQELLALEPMMPIALIEKSLPFEEVKRARDLAVCSSSDGNFYSYWVGCGSVAVSLPALGKDGRAITIPRVLDHMELAWTLGEYPLDQALLISYEVDSAPNKKTFPISVN